MLHPKSSRRDCAGEDNDSSVAEMLILEIYGAQICLDAISCRDDGPSWRSVTQRDIVFLGLLSKTHRDQ